MKKSDGIISLIIGFFIGIFFFIILKSIQVEIPYSWALIILFPILSLIGMFVASFLGKKFLIIMQVAKFGLVGALNTFIDFGILNLLILFTGITAGLYYSLLKGISFVAAAINSYFWNKHWTFEKKEQIFKSGEFLKFFMVTFVGFILNVGIATFIVNVIGPMYQVSEAAWAGVIGPFVAVLIAFIWNFLGSKFIVFKK